MIDSSSGSRVVTHNPVYTTDAWHRRTDGGGGWIRTNVAITAADLQSAPFSHSGTPPARRNYSRCRIVSTPSGKRQLSPGNRATERRRALLRNRGKRLSGLRRVQKPGELFTFRAHDGPGFPPDCRAAGHGWFATPPVVWRPSASARDRPIASASAGLDRTAFTTPASRAAAASNGSPSNSSSAARAAPARARQQQAGRRLRAQAQIDEGQLEPRAFGAVGQVAMQQQRRPHPHCGRR